MDSQTRSGRNPAEESSRSLHPEAQRRIEAEHENLGHLVARLEASEEISTLAVVLEELHAALVDHFATEEAQDGLHRAIGDTAPEKERALEGLFEEHREFLVRLERLRRKIEAAQKNLDSAFEDSHQLAADLKHHEAKETELFLDAVYTEHGGGD